MSVSRSLFGKAIKVCAQRGLEPDWEDAGVRECRRDDPAVAPTLPMPCATRSATASAWLLFSKDDCQRYFESDRQSLDHALFRSPLPCRSRPPRSPLTFEQDMKRSPANPKLRYGTHGPLVPLHLVARRSNGNRPSSTSRLANEPGGDYLTLRRYTGFSTGLSTAG